MRTVLTQVTNVVCSGEFKEFIQDYARHSTFIGPAVEDDVQCPDCAKLLTSLKFIFHCMENKGL